MNSSTDLFRARDVVEILGISRRQLQYWAQTDLVSPSARTPGGHARYSFDALVAPKAAKPAMEAALQRSTDKAGDRHMFLRFSTQAFLDGLER